jgi:4-hydroxybenzoate polyprenyltransferase
MLLPLFVTLLPVLFLAGLARKGLAFRRRHVDMDGDPPISKALFVGSEFTIVIVWGAMAAQNRGANLAFADVPGAAESLSIGL